MSKEQKAYVFWREMVFAERKREALMKHMISLMLTTAGLAEYNLFSKWKLETFNNKAKRAEVARSRILTNSFDLLVRKYHRNLRAGVNGVAKDSFNTNMRQRILGKLAHVAYGKTKDKFENWKHQVHTKLKME
jgi:hypothetical protein